jgi:AraC-like DNA-binding protein
LIAQEVLYPQFPGIAMLFSSSVFLKAPILYIYILSVINVDFKLKKNHIFHLIPFVLDFLIYLPNFYLGSYEEKINLLTGGMDSLIERKISYLIIHTQITVYLVLSFKKIFNYKKVYYQNFSSKDKFIYNWLLQLMIIITFTDVIALSKNIFLFKEVNHSYQSLLLVAQILSLVFISWFVLKALLEPKIFSGIKLSKFSLIDKENMFLEKKGNKELERLLKYMEKEKPYLNSSLTLEDLAYSFGRPKREVSELINQNFNIHFFDFVNSYRIKNAMKILKNIDNSKLTILEILYIVGFNSKSSFNSAFKKHTGLTPTKYRSHYLSK